MNFNSINVLVTGGAGYIGSHTVLALQNQGYQITILDNLIYGHRELIEIFPAVKLIVGDINDAQLLKNIFSTYDITAVIHFAAYAYVGESITDPRKYYRNNVVGSLTLLEAMVDHGINKIVFSSTCATYGIPDTVPITEDQLQNPINPYGMSKLAVEKILLDFRIKNKKNESEKEIKHFLDLYDDIALIESFTNFVCAFIAGYCHSLYSQKKKP
jgi:UDP-glucose 4-epimerase